MTTWKYTDSTNSVVTRVLEDGRMQSTLVSAPEIQDWLAEGNTPLPADHPDPNAAILAQIVQLESQVTIRRIREAYSDSTWMNGIEAQIEVLRNKLV
jgi:hypothetical protein